MADLEHCCAEYLNHLAVERNLASNTIAAYRRDLRAYRVFLADRGIYAPDDVTRRDVEDFIASKHAAHAADSSVNRALSSVKGLHRFLVREGLSSAQPTATMRVPKMADRLPDVISIDAACSTRSSPPRRRACATEPCSRCCMAAACAPASSSASTWARCIWMTGSCA